MQEKDTAALPSPSPSSSHSAKPPPPASPLKPPTSLHPVLEPLLSPQHAISQPPITPTLESPSSTTTTTLITTTTSSRPLERKAPPLSPSNTPAQPVDNPADDVTATLIRPRTDPVETPSSVPAALPEVGAAPVPRAAS